MKETSGRLLRLLGLLQTRRVWTGDELAARLGVTVRTVRRDMEKLRDLEYPVEAARGVSGGYRLGAGAVIPPLQLEDDEAVAIAVGLRTAARTGLAGAGESALRALAKLEQVLPSRLRRRARSLNVTTVQPRAPGPGTDPDVLTELAAACRDQRRLRFEYVAYDGASSRRDVEGYDLVNWGSRWYLIGWDVDRRDWRTFRVDRIVPRPPHGRTFTPRKRPYTDPAAYLLGRVDTQMWPCQARLRLHAPYEAMVEHIPAGATLEPDGPRACLLSVGGESWPVIAVLAGYFLVDFEVLDPPVLREHLHALARRYFAAAGAGSGREGAVALHQRRHPVPGRGVEGLQGERGEPVADPGQGHGALEGR
jgi:predicted DNA-binding transcriptional regulator YafY